MAEKWSTLEEVEALRPVNEDEITQIKARIYADMRAARLADLRKELSLSQEQLAETIGVGQRRVSAIEHGDVEHTQLSTVRAYVEALGGTVEVIASFGDERVIIS